MHTKTFGIYPLVGRHLGAICFKQEISNLLLHNALNISQSKFNWGINVPLWSRMRLYLIVFIINTVKLLAVNI